MKFIDPANSCCGRYEGGENPYSLAPALWATSTTPSTSSSPPRFPRPLPPLRPLHALKTDVLTMMEKASEIKREYLQNVV